MKYLEQNRLETFVERHRADFDPHEPRPDLWAALEQQLHAETPAAPAPLMSVVPGGETATAPELGRQLPFPKTAPAKRWRWVDYYGVAAALLVVMLAAGLSENWKSDRVAAERGAARAASTAYLAPAGEPTPSLVSQTTNARLDTAVRGMEAYYASQLTDRKAELSQLAPEAAAEWSSQLVELDSSYQQLKRQLPQHPQPEVVLTAMNRNLQIRLDILDRQLQLRNPGEVALTGDSRGEYALADSRQFVEASLRHER